MMRPAIDVYRHAYAERMADWKTNDEQLANAAAVIEADREQAAAEERAKIVAYLLDVTDDFATAEAIRDEEHLK